MYRKNEKTKTDNSKNIDSLFFINKNLKPWNKYIIYKV